MSLLKLLGFLRQATPGVPDSCFCDHHGMYAHPIYKAWAVRRPVGRTTKWVTVKGPPAMECPLC